MRLNRFRIRGMGPFRDEVSLDLDALGDARMIAVTGLNGAGKSFALETAVAGALYRKMPTQGTLPKRATAKDSLVEATFTNGQRFTLRHMVDGVSGGSEVAVLDDNRKPLTEKGNTKEFGEWAKRHLPDESLFFASVFGAQESRGFVGASPGERKGLILRAKGIEHYEAMAKACSDSATAARRELEVVLARIEEAGQIDVETRRAELAETELTAEQADHAVGVCKRRVLEAVGATAAHAANTKAREESAVRLAELEQVLAESRSTLADIETRLANNKAVLADAVQIRAAEERARELSHELPIADAKASDLKAKLQLLEAEITRLNQQHAHETACVAEATRRAEVAEGRLRDEDRIREAVARLPGLEEELAEAERALKAAPSAGELKARAEALDAIDQRVSDDCGAAGKGAVEAGERADAALARLADEAAVQAAVEALDGKRAAVEAAERADEAVRSESAAGDAARVKSLRTGLESIAEIDPDAVEAAGLAHVLAVETLERDDETKQHAEQLPDRLLAARTAVREARAELEATQRLAARESEMQAAREALVRAQGEREELKARWLELAAESARVDAERVEAWKLAREAQQKLDQLAAARSEAQAATDAARARAAREGEMAAARDDLAQAGRDRDEHDARAREARAAIDGREEERTALAQLVEEATQRAEALRSESDDIKPWLSKVAPLSHAEERIAEYEPRIARLRSDIEAASPKAEAIALELAEPLLEPPSEEDAQRAVQAAEAAANTARDAVAVATERLAQAEADAARIAEHQSERARIETELADWNLLAESLGRNGLQAVEADAAGPELTETLNYLLRECHGPRFTARIDTQRLKADKDLAETCDYVVIDTEKGTEKDAKLHSGGERGLLREVASLALAVMACRTSGMRDMTLIRDEPTAALDEENARVYFTMLRKASDMVGASRVLFVTHNPELISLADARVVVADGGISVLT